MTYKQRTLDFIELEWGTYVERFQRLPVELGEKRVKAQGFERFRDMLAHILAWWEDVMPVILAIAENREYERKKYDFDAFNAEAIAKYKDWEEEKFFAHFEKTRQQVLADFTSMNEAVFEDKRICGRINGVFFHHAREHLVALSRFLVLDTLTHEWAAYPQKFLALEDQGVFLKTQGMENFREMLGHVLEWWEVGAQVVRGALQDPNFSWQELDTDAFNAELVVKYRGLSDADVQALFEQKRQEMLALVNSLPEGALENRLIEDWLAADVVEHFDEHAV